MIMLQPPGSEDVSKSLHQLARDGDAETIRLLFETSYAETMKYINALDEKKLTPLHYAARHSNLEVLKILVQNNDQVHVFKEMGGRFICKMTSS